MIFGFELGSDMLPIVLTPQGARIGIAGKGSAFSGRMNLLNDAGIVPHALFEDREPESSELTELHALFVAGLDESASRDIYAKAEAACVLVNVEDDPKLCDFHVPAQIRRGELLITVSTGGRSPGLAARVREALGEIFGVEWENHVGEIAKSRARWRASGLAPNEVAQRTRDMIDDKGWLNGLGQQNR
ncbi:MAG: NAD(P)-dependent oxidoreductase [Micropepsaceae bacterium]